MEFSHERSLHLAALSSEAQIDLMRSSRLEEFDRPARPIFANSAIDDHLSRIKDRLRKEYDYVVPHALSDELSHLLSQVDRAP
jgi:hypothetical protein